MNTYKDLIVWQKSIQLVIEIYKLTNLFPVEEKFGLVSQMRRCSVSIPSNIAEGYARKNKRENAQFINISFGSATELETQIIIAKKLNLVDKKLVREIDGLLLEILKMLYKYRETLYL
jgi:four helix bundle protein